MEKDTPTIAASSAVKGEVDDKVTIEGGVGEVDKALEAQAAADKKLVAETKAELADAEKTLAADVKKKAPADVLAGDKEVVAKEK